MRDKITIQIVGYNNEKELEEAATGLQEFGEEAIIRYIDNNSKDRSVETVKRLLPGADVIELSENVGFAEANNVGFRLCQTELVMLHNPDLQASLEGVRRVREVFKDKHVGAAQGKLYRNLEGEMMIVDSAGIEMTLTLNGRERGAGDQDEGQFEDQVEVGAVTGAGCIYRRSALEDVAHKDGEVFDKDFFMYKEDVDLGWRLRRRGWQCVYVPVEMGVHPRVVRKITVRQYLLQPSKLIAKISDQRTRWGWRNWVWMLVKNVRLSDVKYEIFVDLRLICLMLVSLFYWPLMTMWVETVKGIPNMLRKRA